MPTKATAGLKPCATTSESSKTTNDGYTFCSASADGFDAQPQASVRRACAGGAA